MNNRGTSFSYQEIKLIEKYFPTDGENVLVNLTGRSSYSILLKAYSLGIKRKVKIPHHRKPKNNIVAAIIEDYINDPGIDYMFLAKKYNVSGSTVLRYISFWFSYKGENKEILVLKSKV